MARFQVVRELIFRGYDLDRPRMTAEGEKLRARFPGFKFYSIESRITSIKGYLRTSYGGRYYVSIEVPGSYPYGMPTVKLPNHSIEHGVHHKFSDHEPCVMKSDQWSSTLSLAFMVAKTAVWLNKYDSWKRNGRRDWPGTEQ